MPFLLLSLACQKEDPFINRTPPTPPKTFELYIDYWNPDGQSPQIRFNEQLSSPEVQIDFKKTFGGKAVPPHFSNVVIDNVRIIDAEKTHYTIDGIDAYEWRKSIQDWKHDVEFVMTFGPVDRLDVVLALDASASMGEDFSRVKTYAQRFIDNIFENHPNAQVGLVDFSDRIQGLPLTSDRTLITNYMDQVQQGPFTSLYEAMDRGIQHLKQGEAESRCLLTFTDGTDNNSKPEYTPAQLITSLHTDPPVHSYTIGLEGFGGVDKTVLQALAAHSGVAAFPKDVNALEDVFETFSSSIAHVYKLVYTRNQQVIAEDQPLKLRFVISAKAQ